MTSIPLGSDHPHYDRTIEDFFDDDTDPYADISYWSKAAYWTIEEGTALSFGYEPRVVTSEWVQECETPFKRKYDDLKSLAQRARDTGELTEPITPASYIKWFGTGFFPELEQTVQNRGKQPRGAGGLNRSAEQNDKKNLLKMLLGTAVAKYSYNPEKPSPAEKIKHDLEKSGLTIDEGTVLKWLREAYTTFSDIVKIHDKKSM